MKLCLSKKANLNYLAKVVEIQNFRKHSDPEVERLKCCTIDGFNIITGIDSTPGKYIYFPVMCQINPNILSFCNLYRHAEKNRNTEKTGMFEDNGRVKAIKLRGELSEGFIMPYEDFNSFLIGTLNKELNAPDEMEFDSVEHEGKEFWVCRKYIIQESIPRVREDRKRDKSAKFDKVIDNQFRFHYETELLRKVPNIINPFDIIHISEKIHGTSGISANILCLRPLTWYEKVYKWFNKTYTPTVYDNLYASRTVIKNKYYNKSVTPGFYGVDVWEYANKVVAPLLPKGMTAYYEIVGFLPNGGYIQKNYDYGCVPPKSGETYTHEKHFKVRIYRLTLTNVDGYVHEFSPREVQQWCNKVGLTQVTPYYYGLAIDLYPEIRELVFSSTEQNGWNKKFLNKLANDKRFYMEELSPSCSNPVPHEGIVIKIENGKSEAFKLKCFKFLDKEQIALDKGETNIEDQA